MKTYIVSMAVIQHLVYELKVEAKSKEEAEKIAKKKWDKSDYEDVYEVVHSETFVNQVEEAK